MRHRNSVKAMGEFCSIVRFERGVFLICLYNAGVHAVGWHLARECHLLSLQLSNGTRFKMPYADLGKW